MSYHFYVVAHEGFFKFGDSEDNHEARLDQYKTHNPQIDANAYHALELHGNATPAIMGTALKKAIKMVNEKSVMKKKFGTITQVGEREWFKCNEEVVALVKRHFFSTTIVTKKVLQDFFDELLDGRKCDVTLKAGHASVALVKPVRNAAPLPDDEDEDDSDT